jgi:steroid 5-alpha reductase family enzyme
MNTLQITLVILIAATGVSFLYGLFTRNYSTVDRLWSILPAVYVLVWMKDFYENPRFIIGSILIIAWAIRLSMNFARRGGYNFSFKKGFTEEDYRWPVLKEKIPNRFLFELFNLVFISAFQLGLVFMITLPMYYVGLNNKPLNILDFIFFAFHLVFLIGETAADNQQYLYYTQRDSDKFKDSPRHQLGFNTFGLWKISRHPNYSLEMSQWLVVALYAWNAVSGFHWTTVGIAVLIALFVGSTGFAQSITRTKYPRYDEWCKASSAWMPFIGAFKQAKNRKVFMESLKN